MAFAVSALLSAQSTPTAVTVPRTPDGRPNLQGIWDYRSATPLERPREYADKLFFTEDEARTFEQRTAERRDGIVAVHPPFWLDYGAKLAPDLRTSLIVDPGNGRVPPLTAEARARVAADAAATASGRADGPEDRSIQERCLVFGAGPPILPGPYNNNIQIVQTAAEVVIVSEMIHDARIVPLDGRPLLPAGMRRWLGDSRGHWDGDTLVIETSNFTDRTPFRGSDEHLRVVERFTAIDAGALQYRVHNRQPDRVYRSMDGRDAHDAYRGGDVPVRLPRGELRAAGHPARRPVRGTSGHRRVAIAALTLSAGPRARPTTCRSAARR